MGLMDKVKGLLKGREKQVKSGIDTVSNQVERRVGPKYASKIDDVSHKAQDAVDKLGGHDKPTPGAAATPDPADTPTPPGTAVTPDAADRPAADPPPA